MISHVILYPRTSLLEHLGKPWFSTMSSLLVIAFMIACAKTQQWLCAKGFGGDGENNVNATPYINQGIITGIASWGLWNGAIGNFSWYIGYGDNQSTSSNYGYHSYYHEPCKPFQLNTTDYIIGYRVIYRDLVYGLTFYTKMGNYYECSSNTINLSGITDTGIISYGAGYYLSGFYLIADALIDQIGFQFTSYNQTLHWNSNLDPMCFDKPRPTVKCGKDCNIYCAEDCIIYSKGLDETKSMVHLYIYCTYDECRNIFIDAAFAESITIDCSQSGGCSWIIINGTYVGNISIIANADEAATDITIYAEEAGNVEIYAKGKGAFKDSVIFCINAGRLNVACYNAYDDIAACYGTRIYLSDNEGSNSLDCKYGCSNLELYFMDDINVDLFRNITLNECAACPVFGDCIDEWIIYYDDYNSSIIYPGNSDQNMNISLFDYINASYHCSSFESMLFNEPYKRKTDIISITIAVLSILILLIPIHDLCVKLRNLYKKIKYNEWISKKPSPATLRFSMLADFIIIFTIFYWLIRINDFHNFIMDYCGTKYPDIHDETLCDDDIWCEYFYFESGAECDAAGTIWRSKLAYWFLLVAVYSVSIGGVYLGSVYKACQDRSVNHCICCVMEDYAKNLDLCIIFSIRKDGYIVNNGRKFAYLDRGFWIYRSALLWYILIQSLRYGVWVIITWILVIVFGDLDCDYVIKWYEFYPVLVLVVVKIVMQLCYTYGPEYNAAKETIPIIDRILTDKYGKDVVKVIKLYLPRFNNRKIVE